MTKIYSYSVINKHLIVGCWETSVDNFSSHSEASKGYHKQPTSTSFVALTAQFNNKS
jgi:hypothetical protein